MEKILTIDSYVKSKIIRFIKQNKLHIGMIPQKYIDKDIIMTSLNSNYLNFDFIDKKYFKDSDIIDYMISIKYIPTVGVKYVCEVYKDNLEMLIKLSTINDQFLKYIDDSYLCELFYLNILNNGTCSIKYFKKDKLTYKICYESLKYDGYNMKYIPEKFIDNRICLMASKHKYGIRFIPEEFITEEIVQNSIRGSLTNIAFVPKKYFNIVKPIIYKAIYEDNDSVYDLFVNIYQNLEYIIAKQDNFDLEKSKYYIKFLDKQEIKENDVREALDEDPYNAELIPNDLITNHEDLIIKLVEKDPYIITPEYNISEEMKISILNYFIKNERDFM